MKKLSLIISLLVLFTNNAFATVANTKWYLDSVAWSAMTAWSNHTAVAGELIRQLTAPAAGSERAFVAIVAGATGSTEPTWVVTKGAKNVSSAATYQEVTGQPCVNGDIVNSPTWLANKNTAVVLGQIIYDSVSLSCQIVSTAGTEGNASQPSFSATAGTTTVDNTVTWTSLGLASSFGGWAAPFAKFQSAVASTWMAAGDTLYAATEHSESQNTNIGITFPGIPANPNLIVSVTKTNVPPGSANDASGATVATSNTGNNPIVFAGSFKMRGMTISSGGSITFNNAQSDNQYLQNCSFVVSTRNAADTLTFSGGAGIPVAILDNSTIQFTNAANTITFTSSGISFEWKNTPTAIKGSIIPNVLFSGLGNPQQLYIHGVDLSAITTTLFDLTGVGSIRPILANVKINSGVTLMAGAAGAHFGNGSSGLLTLINVDSGATGYRNEWHSYPGDITTSIATTRKNGDTILGQSVSHQFATDANASPIIPMQGPTICQQSSFSSGTHTATIEIAGAQSLNIGDMWFILEEQGSASSPLSTLVSTGLANPFSTNSAIATSSVTWNGSPAFTQHMIATYTPAAAGNVCATIYMSKPSTTEFVDFKMILSTNDNEPLLEKVA